MVLIELVNLTSPSIAVLTIITTAIFKHKDFLKLFSKHGVFSFLGFEGFKMIIWIWLYMSARFISFDPYFVLWVNRHDGAPTGFRRSQYQCWAPECFLVNVNANGMKEVKECLFSICNVCLGVHVKVWIISFISPEACCFSSGRKLEQERE